MGYLNKYLDEKSLTKWLFVLTNFAIYWVGNTEV